MSRTLLLSASWRALFESEPDRGEDAVAVLADCAAEADERRQAATGQARQQPVEQHLDVLDAQAGGEDAADGLLELVGAPHLVAGAAQFAVGGGLAVGEVVGVLQQHPAGVLEALGGRSRFQPGSTARVAGFRPVGDEE